MANLQFETEHGHHEWDKMKLTFEDDGKEPKVSIKVDDQRVSLTFDELEGIYETFKQFHDAKRAMENE